MQAERGSCGLPSQGNAAVPERIRAFGHSLQADARDNWSRPLHKQFRFRRDWCAASLLMIDWHAGALFRMTVACGVPDLAPVEQESHDGLFD